MMQTIPFSKMHGAGNDYVYVDANMLDTDMDALSALAVRISDRHFGVGSDGLVVITPSDAADFGMRMFNADGSEAGMCGNASRCVGKYLYEKGFTDKTVISLETKSGIKILDLHVEDGEVKSVTVDMGCPSTESADIPVNVPYTRNIPVAVNGTERFFNCVSMGNPHAVTFVSETAGFDVEGEGWYVENLPLFPQRTNVEFVQVLSPEEINMRVWERGSGETLACGTGACASVVAAVLGGRCGRKVRVHLLGGDVDVEWRESDGRVYLTGGAEWVFEGVYFVK